MKDRYRYLQHLAISAELPGESILRQPVVELFGDHRVLIERHCGVTEYGGTGIRVKVQNGYIQVCGCDLELARMSKEQLVITGKITGVTLHRGK